MISVIIPVYNHAKAIKTCFDSLLNQSFKNFEVIVVNDGSTDDLQDVLNNYEKIFSDRNIFFKIVNQENRGASVARNNGFLKSVGEYIIFLDADIKLNKKMLMKMADILDSNENVSYVYSSFRFGWKKFKLWPFSVKRLKEMPYIHTSSLIRRKHFPGFDENLKKFQDWDLWLQMLEMGYKGYFLPKVLFSIRSGGTMSSWMPSIFYKIPWQKLGIKLKEIDNYNNSLAIINKKYNL